MKKGNDKDGNQIAKIGLEKRKKVDYDDLPQVLIDAIIATEDSRYYQHNGFDLPRFAKASVGQVVNKLTHHGNAGGGSTISMQVVKNNFTDTEQTITRKFTDIYISIFKLEKNYSKEYNDFDSLLKQGKNKFGVLMKFSLTGQYEIKLNISYSMLSLLVFTQSNAFFTLFSNSPTIEIAIPRLIPFISPFSAFGMIVIYVPYFSPDMAGFHFALFSLIAICIISR